MKLGMSLFIEKKHSIHDIGNFLFIGIVEMGLQIFAFVIVYKILTTYHTQIFEAVELKAATTFDQAVESTKQDATGWGHRI